MPMKKEEPNLFLDKFLSIDGQLRHIIDRAGTLRSFLGSNVDFIDEAMFPFAVELKRIGDRALKRLEEVGEENRERILGSRDYERR